MDSKQRTKILYDDPNSIFKANRTVYLHELQGSTLKSKKPLPEDVNAGMKTSDSMVKLISKLSQLQVIVETFFSVFNDPAGMQYFAYTPSNQNIKEGSSLVTSIIGLIKQLLKVPQSSFNEDDIFSILRLYQDINEKMQYITNEIMTTHPGIMEQFFLGTPYQSFHKKIQSLFDSLDKLIPYANISGVSLPDINNVQPYAPPIPEEENFQDAQEPPNDLEPAPPLEEGAGRRRRIRQLGGGRYHVLSNRVRVIQQQPYKRFL